MCRPAPIWLYSYSVGSQTYQVLSRWTQALRHTRAKYFRLLQTNFSDRRPLETNYASLHPYFERNIFDRFIRDDLKCFSLRRFRIGVRSARRPLGQIRSADRNVSHPPGSQQILNRSIWFFVCVLLGGPRIYRRIIDHLIQNSVIRRVAGPFKTVRSAYSRNF